MRIFVTGGSGFVGINVIEEFLNKGFDVINYDCIPMLMEAEQGFRDTPGRYTFILGDVMDREQIKKAICSGNVDTIVHMAAITPTIETEKNFARRIYDINCGGTINVLDAAIHCGVKRFIHVSSIAAYGSSARHSTVLTEDMDDLRPENLYEITKYSSEKMALRYKQLYGLNLIIVRLGDVFGAWERPTNFRTTMSAPYQTLKMALENSSAVMTRPNHTSWVYSRDVAAAIFTVTTSTCIEDIYNIGSTGIWSIEEWCAELKKYYPKFTYQVSNNDSLCNIAYSTEQDNAPMSVERLINIGYRPVYDLEKSASDYISWVENNRHLIK